MAATNADSLQLTHGEDVLHKIKGCEFHFRPPINPHASKSSDHERLRKGNYWSQNFIQIVFHEFYWITLCHWVLSNFVMLLNNQHGYVFEYTIDCLLNPLWTSHFWKLYSDFWYVWSWSITFTIDKVFDKFGQFSLS